MTFSQPFKPTSPRPSRPCRRRRRAVCTGATVSVDEGSEGSLPDNGCLASWRRCQTGEERRGTRSSAAANVLYVPLTSRLSPTCTNRRCQSLLGVTVKPVGASRIVETYVLRPVLPFKNIFLLLHNYKNNQSSTYTRGYTNTTYQWKIISRLAKPVYPSVSPARGSVLSSVSPL